MAGRDAAWLASLPPAPLNRVPAEQVDWSRVTRGAMVNVWANLAMPSGVRTLPAVATGWTAEHVQLEVNVPGRGVLLLWLPASDVTRADDDGAAQKPDRA